MMYVKKIENWLLLPVLILFLCSFSLSGYTLDIHMHDTYFVFEGVSTFRWIAWILLVIFGMYKTIRNRHQNINLRFAGPHMTITLLLTAYLLMPFATNQKYLDYTITDYSKWDAYQNKMQWTAIAILSFFLNQVIFFIYFVVQLLKKPVDQR